MSERGSVALYAVDLARNVVAGTKLALFLPVRPHEFRVSGGHFAVLVLFSFVCWVAAAAVRAGVAGSFGGDFDPVAPAYYLATVTLVLATALLLALAYRAPGQLLLFAVALTASDPVFELASAGVPALASASGHPGWVYFGFIAWTWLVALRAGVVCGGWQMPQALLGALAVSAMSALAMYLLPKTDVWLPPPPAEQRADALADERLFHLQGRLIERQLAAIEPGRAGVPELYFVGFAPDASQEVFLHEMRFVRQLFDRRFATARHSIALASSESALEELPIASVTNLGRALGRVGEAMNADEDVLFLFITAHGDREHRLSAWQPPLALAQLTPTALARMLQQSGVKWRVIVVSACYAGGFIEPLRDENSVVITAAAQDRSSFGCEPDREFTYFGEAYFREALAKTRSFTGAFELAKEIVAKKEADEKLTPSLPQMWVGPAIAERLKNFPQQSFPRQPDKN